MDKCPKCGSNVDPNDVFCKKCGTPLKSTQTLSEQPQADAETTPKPADGFTELVEKLKAKKAEEEAKKAEEKAKKELKAKEEAARIVRYKWFGIGISILLWALGFVYLWFGPTGIALMPIRYPSILWYLIIAMIYEIPGLYHRSALWPEGYGKTLCLFLTISNLCGVVFTCLIFVYSANFTFFSGWVITTFFLYLLAPGMYFTQALCREKITCEATSLADTWGSVLFAFILTFPLSWLLCHPFTASGKEKLARRAEHFPAYQEYYQQRAAEQRASK